MQEQRVEINVGYEKWQRRYHPSLYRRYHPSPHANWKSGPQRKRSGKENTTIASRNLPPFPKFLPWSTRGRKQEKITVDCRAACSLVVVEFQVLMFISSWAFITVYQTSYQMAKVNICNVTVLDNPSPYFNPFQFEITFECLEDLSDGKTNFVS